MLLCLDDSILGFANRSKTEERICRLALENLLNAYREGNHIVVCPPALARNLRQRLFSNNSNQSWLLRSLADEWPILASHIGRFKFSAQIVGDCLIASASRIGAVTTIKLPIEIFKTVSIAQPTVLLTENLEDAKALETMAKVYAVRNRLATIMRYEPVGGGGSTVPDQFELIQSKEARFCLCAVDTDRKSPHDKLGNTAGRVSSVHQPDKHLVDVLYTPCHEIENTLPEAVISQASKSENLQQSLQEIGWFKSNGISGTFEHLDFKEGVFLADLMRFDIASPSGKFWFSAINKMVKLPGILPHINKDCLKNWVCPQPLKCNCKVFSSLGDKLLASANEFFSKNSPHKISEMLDLHSEPLWNELGGRTFEMCCGWRPKLIY